MTIPRTRKSEDIALFHKPPRFMEEFSSRHINSATIEHCGRSTFLSIERPTTLASFFAYCSGQTANTRIFLRGCTENHTTAYPSLFRPTLDENPEHDQTTRWLAYKYLLENLRKLDGRRWRRKDLGAVLQHYGIRTPWLDVARNLYSATWFATHELRGSGLHGVISPSLKDHPDYHSS